MKAELFITMFIVTLIVFSLLGYEIGRWVESRRTKSEPINCKILAKVIACEMEAIKYQKESMQTTQYRGIDKQ